MPLTKAQLKQISRDLYNGNHRNKRYTRSELIQIKEFNMSFLNDEIRGLNFEDHMNIFMFSAFRNFFLFKQLLPFEDDLWLLEFLIINLFKMTDADTKKALSLILRLQIIDVNKRYESVRMTDGPGNSGQQRDHADINVLSMAIIKKKLPLVMELINQLDAEKKITSHAYDELRSAKPYYMNLLSIRNWDDFFNEFEEIIDPEQRAIEEEEKKERDSFRENMRTNARTEVSRTKAKVQRQKQRTNNKICTNSIDFILQEDIGDIPKEDLIYIKKGAQYYCFEKDSFAGMIKYSTPVRGACKPAVRGQPLDCEDFYPINLGFNVYISEENWIDIEERTDIKKWKLTNKRVVDFTTGLHMMSEKTGKDDVYDLVPADYQVGGKKLKLLREKKRRKKRRKVLKKKCARKPVKKCARKPVKKCAKKRSKKRIRKHQGINQRTGRLNKGYGYSKEKMKSGMRKIIKKKMNKK